MNMFVAFILLLRTIISHNFYFSESIEQITTMNTMFPVTITRLQISTQLCPWKSTVHCGNAQQITIARQHILDQKQRDELF